MRPTGRDQRMDRYERSDQERFEREFGRSLVFRPVGAAVAGLLFLLLGMSDERLNVAPLTAPAGAITLAVYLYVWGHLVVIRWLSGKTLWSYLQRRVLFIILFLAPALVLTGVAALLHWP